MSHGDSQGCFFFSRFGQIDRVGEAGGSSISISGSELMCLLVAWRSGVATLGADPGECVEEHPIYFLPSYKWQPETDAYDMRSQKHVPVRMAQKTSTVDGMGRNTRKNMENSNETGPVDSRCHKAMKKSCTTRSGEGESIVYRG